MPPHCVWSQLMSSRPAFKEKCVEKSATFVFSGMIFMLHEEHDVKKREPVWPGDKKIPPSAQTLPHVFQQFSLVTSGVCFKSSTGGSQLTRHQQPAALPRRRTLALNTERVVTIPDCTFSWISLQMDHMWRYKRRVILLRNLDPEARV